jgi:hypothetical protein
METTLKSQETILRCLTQVANNITKKKQCGQQRCTLKIVGKQIQFKAFHPYTHPLVESMPVEEIQGTF